MFTISTKTRRFMADSVTPLAESNHPRISNIGSITLSFQLIDDAGAGVDITGKTFSLGIDTNFSHADILAAFTDTCTADDASAGKFTAVVEVGNSIFEQKAGTNYAGVQGYIEILMYSSGSTVPEQILLDTVRLLPCLIGDSGAPENPDPVYYTAAQVNALVGAANVYQYHAGNSVPASDSADWSDTLTSASRWYRERKNVTNSTWGAPLPLGRSTVIIDTISHDFSTTAGQAAELTITKTALGIASDAEPQLSLWSVGETGKTKASDTTYTAKWTSSALVITYYTTWPLGDWTLKLS